MDVASLFLGALSGGGVAAVIAWWLVRTRVEAGARMPAGGGAGLGDAAHVAAKKRARARKARLLRERVAAIALSENELGAELSQTAAKLADDAARATQADAADLSHAYKRLHGAVVRLQRGAGQVTDALASSMEDERARNHRADDMLAAANQVLARAADFETRVHQMSQAAGDALRSVSSALDDAAEGYRAIHETLEHIERVRQHTAIMRARILALDSRAADITDVVRVIEGISDKTHLLALNASIIAAQAGDSGRSFAVVAREVKVLAQRTAASTQAIGEEIRCVKEESERAVEAMALVLHGVGDRGGEAGEGFEVACAAGDSLDSVRTAARSAKSQLRGLTRALASQVEAARSMVDAATRLQERSVAWARAQPWAERAQGVVAEVRAAADGAAELSSEQSANAAALKAETDDLAQRTAAAVAAVRHTAQRLTA
ncbi:MAG TPA: methyl-accepting chemotaxis protein, partial [Kofleriaceae bacterium]|nr:methyl-accepting chemotaxis protein [Kofleriaceae bacterium]